MKKMILRIGVLFCGLLLLLIIYNHLPEAELPSNKRIDRIVIEKSKRQLHVLSEGTVLKTYTISLGFNPVGDKEFEGDGKTPEGKFIINDKNPNSSFYLNLGISYPDQNDIQSAKEFGKSPGGDIKIHGLRNGLGIIGKFHRLFDWTQGCIAVTNTEIEELYENVQIGTQIEIKK